jgi:hypothetical protein
MFVVKAGERTAGVVRRDDNSEGRREADSVLPGGRREAGGRTIKVGERMAVRIARRDDTRP